MGKTIFTYNCEKIDEIKKGLKYRCFVGIGLIFNLAPSVDDIKNINYQDNDFVIDLTTLAFESGYYKVFLECYLYELISSLENVYFVVDIKQKDSLMNRFPHLFDNVDETYSFNENSLEEDLISKDDIKFIDYIPLSLYTKSSLENYRKIYKIVSIGSFFDGVDNFNYSFNIKKIKETLVNESIQYIDITSVIELFSLRNDLIITFDILLRQFYLLKKDIIFLICEEQIDRIKMYLPVTFTVDSSLLHKVEDIDKRKEIEQSFISIEIIKDELNQRLKGHNKFKKDFSVKLQKYILLNKLRERKIFSVFLTGESGIGKTEFAKILSEIMYPEETLIKINFGNYSNEGVLNSLIGSPLGYIGSGEGGELINKIRLSQSKIILIDEFEKANYSVFNFFYELLEDGKFTDRHGMEHNLDGYIIIFTSNMTRKKYIENLPDPLKSRFDLVYCFLELPQEEKRKYVIDVADKLIDKIYEDTKVKIEINCVELEMENLIQNNNLRIIKRKIEDIVISEYYGIKSRA